MSEVKSRGEKRHEVAGNPETDTSATVNVTVKVTKPNEETLVTKREFGEESRNKDTVLIEKNLPSTETVTEKVTDTTTTNDDNNLKSKAKNVMSDTYEKGKEKLSDMKSKMQRSVNMNSLMQHARYCLNDLMNPSLDIEKQIPVELLSNAYGLLFLTEIKGGMGVGSSMGLGVIIARKPNAEGWTGPCAIGMGGLSIGFQIGLQKTEHIFILRDKDVLKTFMNKSQLKLGSDASFSMGPLGRDANIGLNVNDKGYAAIYSYSMATGIYAGTSLEGQVIMIRDDCNEEYYGKKVSAKHILLGNVDSLPSDTEYTSLVNLIEEYTKLKGQLSQDLFLNENREKEEDEYWKNFENFSPNERNWENFDVNKERPSSNIENEEENLMNFENSEKSKNQFSDTYTKSKQQMKSAYEKSKNQISDTYNKGKERINEAYQKGKDKIKERLSMDRLLIHARFTLQNFMNPKLNAEKYIPVKLLSNARGLIFLTEFKGGFGVGGSFGEGFIIARKPNDLFEWSQPCAIGMGGVSLGFQMGVQKTEHIFVIHDEKLLKTFATKGQLKLGGDVSFSIGPLGRDADVSLNFSEKGYAPMYSYSMANGIYVGATMQSQVLMIRDNCNEEYFGKKMSMNDIIFGDVQPISSVDNSYCTLVNLIKEYTQTKGNLNNDSFWNEQEKRDEEEFWSQNENEQTSNIKSEEEKEDQQLNMHRLLTYAHENLENFVSPNLNIEKQIPIKLLRDAYAIIFLTELKAGFFVGASIGTGIILARKLNEKGKWTGPCAISLGGMSVGFQVGMQKTNHIIVLRDENVLNTFTNKGELKIGGDASFSIGPLGRDCNIALNVSSKGSAALYSYSMSKGAYIGTSLEGQLITIRNDCNEEYYGRKVTSKEILFGDVQPLQDNEYNLLCQSLNKHITFKETKSDTKDIHIIGQSNVPVRVVTDIHKEEIFLNEDKVNKKTETCKHNESWKQSEMKKPSESWKKGEINKPSESWEQSEPKQSWEQSAPKESWEQSEPKEEPKESWEQSESWKQSETNKKNKTTENI